MLKPLRVFLSLVLLSALLSGLAAAPARGQSGPNAERVQEEAQTVYLGNLARRQNGVPPLRWNLQLTNAARWFAWDSVENRPEPYCGHQDSQGHWPGDRARANGYLGFSGAENAFCGYVTPQQAIDGWMNSPGHRANLLDPGSREVGLGYYVRASDGRGYVAQGFGQDIVYPPAIIDNEALNTPDPQVDLYIYDRNPGGGFASLGPAVEMQIANDACFTGAAWQPYQAETAWNLPPGQGWRSVYVKTRDAAGRQVTAGDSIYLGPAAPANELGPAQMSTTQPTLTLTGLNGGALNQVQLSPTWRVDDSYNNFVRLWGNGATASDPAAWGGSAFRMTPGDGESSASVWTTEFVKDTPLVAYVRLKVSDNSSSAEVARLSATGGGAARSLKGSDFTAAGQYQEVPIAFNFPTAETFLTFQFWRSGAAEVWVDAVTIFTAPQPLSDPLVWSVPGGNYRGQAVWVRYTDGAGQFSAIQEADLTPRRMHAAPAGLAFSAILGDPAPAPQTAHITPAGCPPAEWSASDDAAWLSAQRAGDLLQVQVDPSGLPAGAYQGTVTLSASGAPPLQVPVTLAVSRVQRVYLPVVQR